MNDKVFTFGPLGKEVSKETLAIVGILTEAGLTIGQARAVLRDVAILIENTPVLVPLLQEGAQQDRDGE